MKLTSENVLCIMSINFGTLDKKKVTVLCTNITQIQLENVLSTDCYLVYLDYELLHVGQNIIT